LTGIKVGIINPFGRNLQLSVFESASIQLDCIVNGGIIRKFKVGESLGFASVFIADDGYAFDRATGFKVHDQFFGSGGIVHLTHIYGVSVSFDFFIGSQRLRRTPAFSSFRIRLTGG
jgi:hypothetical protein